MLSLIKFDDNVFHWTIQVLLNVIVYFINFIFETKIDFSCFIVLVKQWQFYNAFILFFENNNSYFYIWSLYMKFSYTYFIIMMHTNFVTAYMLKSDIFVLHKILMHICMSQCFRRPEVLYNSQFSPGWYFQPEFEQDVSFQWPLDWSHTLHKVFRDWPTMKLLIHWLSRLDGQAMSHFRCPSWPVGVHPMVPSTTSKYS